MRKLVTVVSLICLFLLGGVCGFFIAVRIVKKSLDEVHVVSQRIAEETRRLKLSPEQVDKAMSSYTQMKQDLVAVKQDTFQAIARAAITQSNELAKILTTEQLDEFEKLNEERRIKFEKMLKP